MKIIAFGDIHMDYQAIHQIPDLHSADLVIVTGDFTNFGGREDAAMILEAIMEVNPRVLALMGNLDNPSVKDFLEEKGICLHGKGIIFNDELGIFGVGGSNITPFNTPIEFTEEELSRLAYQGYKMVEKAPVKVFVSHTPPKDTKTDRISSGLNVGSTAIREFIEKEQPDFCLTGHIHESRAEDKIGKTHILNPGMLKDPGWIELIKQEDGSWLAKLN